MTGRFFGGKVPIVLNPSSTYGYDIFTAAGSPNYPALVVVNIAAGVTLTQPTTGTGWIAGSKIQINNNGRIAGNAGNGGKGADYAGFPANGSNGSNALTLLFDVTIANAGQIFGGGGGGGGGTGNPISGDGGGGGGGGQGAGNAGGGAGGASNQPIRGTDGSPGENGSPDDSGSGGAPNGYSGGGWGSPGGGGSTYGIGGAAGKAIALNGHVATFISGNDSTHVKGQIS